MNRWLRTILVLAALVAAFCLTFVWQRQNALDFDIDTSPRARAAKKRVPYDLSSVRVLKTIVTKVNNNYVEPERIDHRRMLLSGLNAIQKQVAPVLVHHGEDQPAFRVQVNDQMGEFRIDDVNSPWQLTWRFQEVFKFLQEHLREDEDIKLRDVEYAAVNGMLRTLDPHSVLLTPEEYSEMQLSTRGEFGGLGIVISIRDGQLTIIRPMPGTPAHNAGLHRKDRIVKINDESTLNMPLEEAVKRLRGAPGSSVAVWVVREGAFDKPRRFDLERAVIHIDSVESRMLRNNIGYVQIKNFQSNTCDDIRSALNGLHAKQMKGLVMDLRDNPGGLLQQAVCVADLFLSSGTIVTTSSNDPDKREPKAAHVEGTQPLYPMVVLANGGSASASEIVAGALKNHDRALVVGDRTFGKGSVQVLYSDDNDGWALKLTIAQYLTPGDVSIQGVGIVPDVKIEPMTVDPIDMDLTLDSDYPRESDLMAHLTHSRARNSHKPAVVLRYYLPEATRQRLREARPEDLEENEKEDEFLTKFSRDLLARATRPLRRDLLRDAEPVIEAAAKGEMQAAVAELRRLGVDWSVGPDKGPSEVAVEVSTSANNNRAVAGDPFELRVSLTNKGGNPLYQLRAVTKSDNRLFSERELVFGKLMPGETRTWATTLGVCKRDEKTKKRNCALPKGLRDRADGVRVEFSEAHGHLPRAAEIRTQVRALPTPDFAYTVHVADDGRGNGDGHLQPGELATVYLKLRNVGEGVSEETVANLRNMSGRGILLQAGRFQLGEMKPGDEEEVRFTFEVLPDFDEDLAKLQVSMADTVLRESASEKLEIPIAPKAKRPDPTAREGSVTLKDGAIIYERVASEGEARQIALVRGGALGLEAQAALGDHIRVDLGGGRPGWVAAASVVSNPSAVAGKLVDVLAHMPPSLDVDTGGQLVTRGETVRIKGAAVDDSLVRDVYVYVGSSKVFYQSNRNARDRRRCEFDTKIPLRDGINYVTVVARESNEVASRTTFVVRKDGPDGSLLETPKNDDDLYFSPFDDE
ncbi:MAG: S41 family peptidase [Myxococcales bacterium]|nr:S41 family peptidase [Myxococcales bacterium]MDD9964816.1 S41 family peptidase [Myxococcales bacterium]